MHRWGEEEFLAERTSVFSLVNLTSDTNSFAALEAARSRLCGPLGGPILLLIHMRCSA